MNKSKKKDNLIKQSSYNKAAVSLYAAKNIFTINLFPNTIVLKMQ